jgi:Na+/H+-dicarboxylate symporter
MAASADNPWNFTSNPGASMAAFMGIGLTICAIIVVVPLVIAILVAIWLYKDAEKRGKEGILWVVLLLIASLFLSFLGLVIVLVIWLAIRPPLGGVIQKAERHCPNCGRSIPEDSRVCPYCSKKFEE